MLAISRKTMVGALLAMMAGVAFPILAEEKGKSGTPTVKDEKSGIVVSVKKDDGRSLVAKDLEEKVLWEVDVIKTAGEPGVGAPVVRHLSLNDEQVTAIYGKHSFARFELKSGKMLSSGSD